MFRSTN